MGSLRYRVTFKGPGGHSFAAFGLANPIDALGRAIAKIADFQVPARAEDDVQRRTSGRRHVGELDPVRGLDGSRHAVVGAGVARGSRRAGSRRRSTRPSAEENDRWRTPRMMTVVKERVGDRPAGSTPADSPIVRTAEAVHRALGLPIALQRKLDRLEHSDEPSHSRDYHRRRRPRRRRSCGDRVVRHHRFVAWHGARAAARDRAGPEIAASDVIATLATSRQSMRPLLQIDVRIAIALAVTRSAESRLRR